MLRLMTNRAFGPAGICNPKHLLSVRCFASSKKTTITGPRKATPPKERDATPIKRIAKAYSKISMRDAQERLGFLMKTFERNVISIDKMLSDATPQIEGLDDTQIKGAKERVYENILEFIEGEGYPTEADEDFKEANVNDLVLLIVLPILTAFRRHTGRNLYLEREKKIEAIDSATRGFQEFVAMDLIGVKNQKFVFVIEAKKSSIGQAKKQCLLALKDMRENNGGGVVYGFVTTGEQWQMVQYDGKVFTHTSLFYAVFHTMGDQKEKWMENSSIIVNCIHHALKSGGFAVQ